MSKHPSLLSLSGAGLLLLASGAYCADYLIDTEDAHAFIQFKISHLGYSWLLGQFKRFEGSFSYDPDAPASSHVEVTIQTKSIDTNHAERDKHLRSDKFLDTDKYPQARFVSTAYREKPDGSALLQGELTLHGITHPVAIDVHQIGHGMDPWGGYRRGFEGHTVLQLADYGIDYDLGPSATQVKVDLYLEGIRQKQPIGRRKR